MIQSPGRKAELSDIEQEEEDRELRRTNNMVGRKGKDNQRRVDWKYQNLNINREST
jgi:hypothetical protein